MDLEQPNILFFCRDWDWAEGLNKTMRKTTTLPLTLKLRTQKVKLPF